jgi:hypothetical protein
LRTVTHPRDLVAIMAGSSSRIVETGGIIVQNMAYKTTRLGFALARMVLPCPWELSIKLNANIHLQRSYVRSQWNVTEPNFMISKISAKSYLYLRTSHLLTTPHPELALQLYN